MTIHFKKNITLQLAKLRRFVDGFTIVNAVERGKRKINFIASILGEVI